jgi:hypothetical protein
MWTGFTSILGVAERMDESRSVSRTALTVRSKVGKSCLNSATPKVFRETVKDRQKRELETI